MSINLEITATYLSERHRFAGLAGDTIIADAVIRNGHGLEPVVLKGVAASEVDDEGGDVGDSGRLLPHQNYRFYGHWTTYRNKRTNQDEKQFAFKTFVLSTPHTRAGVVGYLMKAPGIGKAIAGGLYDRFGEKAVEALRSNPQLAAGGVGRLSESVANEAAFWLRDQQKLENCTIELIGLLDGRGFRKSLAKDLVRDFGNTAAAIVSRSPYLLMRYRGVGFKLADALYLSLGKNPASLKRQALCAWYAVASNSSGDTWHYFKSAEQGLRGSIGGAGVEFDKATRLADRGGLLERRYTAGKDGPLAWDGDVMWLAEGRKARNEKRLAELIAGAMGDEDSIFHFKWPSGLSEHQSDVCRHIITRGKIAILGGSPGCGKTYLAASLVRSLVEAIGSDLIAVAGPTGKSAVRISEAMEAAGVSIHARTIHSLLGVEQQSQRDGWSFRHNEKNPLPFKFLVVDEASMIDTDLCCSLLAARPRGCYVLFVGDVNQLSPVGHGAPLRDMIAAGVPYGELREIIRNDGGIVQACADMRDGKSFECGGNLIEVNHNSPATQIGGMLLTIEAERAMGLDPIWDCQVLVAVNKRSELSRKEVNVTLQKHLNLNPPIEGSPFRVGDKCVNLRNKFYPDAGPSFDEPIYSDNVATNERGDIYVANGELGRVLVVEPKYFEVKLSNPTRIVRVPRGVADVGDTTSNDPDDEVTGTGCDWDLAYALSTHKAQGSEFPIVIVLIDEYPGAARICDRSWIYTAVSRAKQRCYLVGKLSTAHRFARANNIDRRKTFLAELVHDQLNPRRPPSPPTSVAMPSGSAPAFKEEVSACL